MSLPFVGICLRNCSCSWPHCTLYMLPFGCLPICLFQAPWAQPWQTWSQAWGYNGSHIASCPRLTHLVKQVRAANLLKHKYFQLVPSDASRLLPPHEKADSLFEIGA